MASYALKTIATEENYDEQGYLSANADLARAISNGTLSSGLEHFRAFGIYEKRYLRQSKIIGDVKKTKLDRLHSILRHDMQMVKTASSLDFPTPELRALFNIIDTHAVSSHEYGVDSKSFIEKHKDGLILDCGAGRRDVYYDNVVNFEIADYDSTDVRGVGEVLPFLDNSFDAVFSLSVLEHVKDPFQCAREIIRVLKPGGDLMCCVPFLQPMHGYPHHYYNMTEQGIKNLFEPHIVVDRHEVVDEVTPIWSLTWILNSWTEGLTGAAREEFLNMKVSDLLDAPSSYENRGFVTELSREKNFELASATLLYGRKIPDTV